MERLINIDNGGTLTDICVWDGENFSFTKTLTTPFDLSQCLFDGMAKASTEIFGEEDLPGLLHSTRHIRYSTTQGTNALVERKGPRIGILTDSPTPVRRTPRRGGGSCAVRRPRRRRGWQLSTLTRTWRSSPRKLSSRSTG